MLISRVAIKRQSTHTAPMSSVHNLLPSLTRLHPAFALLALLTAGCANVEGVFEPACIAFEGDRITLDNGRFEWARFTDVRPIGEDGKEIDPFPDYPKNGRYTVQSQTVEFRTDGGDLLDDHYLLEHNGSLYLLTSGQHARFSDGQSLPECVLRRSD